MRKLITLLLCGILSGNLYAMTAEVIDVNAGIVLCESDDGTLWEFVEDDEWNVGDRVSLVMHDCGTIAEITDDIIISANYEGSAE